MRHSKRVDYIILWLCAGSALFNFYISGHNPQDTRAWGPATISPGANGSQSGSSANDGITLVCLTIGGCRLPDLNYTVSVASEHPDIARIVLIWNDPNKTEGLAALEKGFGGHEKVRLVVANKNSLNNRYDPNLPIETDAVLVIDDDIILTADTITCTYESWKQDQTKIHSFGTGRIVSKYGYGHCRGNCFAKTQKFPVNFLLPRMMFHRKYLSIYFSDRYALLREYVDTQEGHCDDIAFSSLITRYYNSSLQYIPAPFAERLSQGMPRLKWRNSLKGENFTLFRMDAAMARRTCKMGIWTQNNRRKLRKDCARDIVTMLNWAMPEVGTMTTCSYHFLGEKNDER